MTLSETCEITPGYVISRIIRGGWQLAGGHGVRHGGVRWLGVRIAIDL